MWCIALLGASCGNQPATTPGDAGDAAGRDAPVDVTSDRPMDAADAGDVADAGQGPPGIVFVLADDLAWNLVQYMPAVQALQREGMTFTRYFVTDSLCCPSRSSIFTGKYPHDTRVFTNNPPLGGYATFESFGNSHETFAVALQDAGVETAMMGKYLNGYDPTTDPADPGWNTWDVAGDAYAEFNYELDENGQVQSFGSAPADYLTDVLSGFANAFVRGKDKRPFFLEVATFAPHEPYTPAPRYLGTFHEKAPRTPPFDQANVNAPRWLSEWPALSAADIATIDTGFNLRVEAVQAIDDLIASVRRTLKATGRDRNTYIVFSSDNGYHMGEHMLLPGKQTAFDTDIRVPLIVVGPGVPAGVTDEHLVENIDLCPTFTELTGAATPVSADGHSIVPLLRGQTVDRWRTTVLVEHKGPDLAPDVAGDPDNEPRNGPEPNSYEALRMSDSVFVLYRDGETEYYDHSTDPSEMTNSVSGLSPTQVQAYVSKIRSIKTCHSSSACWEAQQ